MLVYLATGKVRTDYQVTSEKMLVERAAFHAQPDMQDLTKSTAFIVVRWSCDIIIYINTRFEYAQ